MIKKLFLFLLLTTFAISGKIEINAQNVTADDNNGITVFSGNVSITRGQDVMRADNIIVYMNDKKDVDKFEATGNTSIYIISENNETFKGSSDEFVYWPLKQLFRLRGDAIIEDTTNKRKLMGTEIIFNEKTKLANVTGKDSKPVKVIFNVEDKKK
jgi:lipopolysaccharide export system protein LptA